MVLKVLKSIWTYVPIFLIGFLFAEEEAMDHNIKAHITNFIISILSLVIFFLFRKYKPKLNKYLTLLIVVLIWCSLTFIKNKFIDTPPPTK